MSRSGFCKLTGVYTQGRKSIDRRVAGLCLQMLVKNVNDFAQYNNRALQLAGPKGSGEFNNFPVVFQHIDYFFIRFVEIRLGEISSDITAIGLRPIRIVL